MEKLAAAFSFKCGCVLDAASLRFEEGRLVCPEHLEDLAPFDRPDAPWRGRATVELVLEAPLRSVAEHVVDKLVDDAFAQQTVRNVLVSIADAA